MHFYHDCSYIQYHVRYVSYVTVFVINSSKTANLIYFKFCLCIGKNRPYSIFFFSYEQMHFADPFPFVFKKYLLLKIFIYIPLKKYQNFNYPCISSQHYCKDVYLSNIYSYQTILLKIYTSTRIITIILTPFY